ncbi:hypothetical protein MTO96_019062 [Rhipicephalus appendiculatus]
MTPPPPWRAWRQPTDRPTGRVRCDDSCGARLLSWIRGIRWRWRRKGNGPGRLLRRRRRQTTNGRSFAVGEGIVSCLGIQGLHKAPIDEDDSNDQGRCAARDGFREDGLRLRGRRKKQIPKGRAFLCPVLWKAASCRVLTGRIEK